MPSITIEVQAPTRYSSQFIQVREVRSVLGVPDKEMEQYTAEELRKYRDIAMFRIDAVGDLITEQFDHYITEANEREVAQAAEDERARVRAVDERFGQREARALERERERSLASSE